MGMGKRLMKIKNYAFYTIYTCHFIHISLATITKIM